MTSPMNADILESVLGVWRLQLRSEGLVEQFDNLVRIIRESALQEAQQRITELEGAVREMVEADDGCKNNNHLGNDEYWPFEDRYTRAMNGLRAALATTADASVKED